MTDDEQVWKTYLETLLTVATPALTYNFLYVEVAMKTMTYSESRARYAETFDSVINDREEVDHRAGRDPVVIVALDDYQSLGGRPTCCAAPRTPAGCWRRSIVLNTAAGPLASC